MEKKIKIITDAGISKKVEQKVWDEIIFQFTQKIKQGHFVAGLSDSIESVANVLETYFPATGEKLNELNNDLIIED